MEKLSLKTVFSPMSSTIQFPYFSRLLYIYLTSPPGMPIFFWARFIHSFFSLGNLTKQFLSTERTPSANVWITRCFEWSSHTKIETANPTRGYTAHTSFLPSKCTSVKWNLHKKMLQKLNGPQSSNYEDMDLKFHQSNCHLMIIWHPYRL